MVNKSNVSIKDILKHAPVLGPLGIGAQPIIMDGGLKIQKSEVIIAKYKALDPTTFLLGLTLGMTREGNRFADIKCTAICPVFYFNGSRSQEDLVNVAGRLSDKTENRNFTIVSRDMLSNNFEMNILNPVWQSRIEEHLSENNDVGAVVFDSSDSLFHPPFDDNTTQQLRNFIIRLRQLNVTQIWAVSQDNKKLDFPDDLATKILSLQSTDNPFHQAISIEMLKDSNSPDEQLKQFILELQDTPEGGLIFVNKESALNDRHVALTLINKNRNQTQIAEALGYVPSTVHHWFKRFKDQGLMQQSGHNYKLTSVGRKYIMEKN